MINRLILLLAAVFFVLDGFALYRHLSTHFLGLGLACWVMVELNRTFKDERKD